MIASASPASHINIIYAFNVFVQLIHLPHEPKKHFVYISNLISRPPEIHPLPVYEKKIEVEDESVIRRKKNATDIRSFRQDSYALEVVYSFSS